MTTKNPFPGMNPFFEQRWRDAHTMLIAYMRDALQDRLPGELVAGAEEEVVTIGTGDLIQSFRPDLQIREPRFTGGRGSGTAAQKSSTTLEYEPMRIFIGEDIERWIEIHDETGRLVTVLELFSPSNKQEPAKSRYYGKCKTFISAGVNLVEIDLARRGGFIFANELAEALLNSKACYGASVFRSTRPGERELYRIRLPERLPVLSVPLRPADDDVSLDLQPLIDQCHERGRYHRLDYSRDPDPPLTPEDAAWVDSRLREHGLR